MPGFETVIKLLHERDGENWAVDGERAAHMASFLACVTRYASAWPLGPAVTGGM